jgi:SAM-dependent methyltransferase
VRPAEKPIEGDRKILLDDGVVDARMLTVKKLVPALFGVLSRSLGKIVQRVCAPDWDEDGDLSTYVLDLLDEDDITRAIAEARRVLAPGGRLCLAGATPGNTPVSRCVMRALEQVHNVLPSLVGGCRPIDLRPFVTAPDWHVLHEERLSVAGITSQALVAEPAASG